MNHFCWRRCRIIRPVGDVTQHMLRRITANRYTSLPQTFLCTIAISIILRYTILVFAADRKAVLVRALHPCRASIGVLMSLEARDKYPVWKKGLSRY